MTTPSDKARRPPAFSTSTAARSSATPSRALRQQGRGKAVRGGVPADGAEGHARRLAREGMFDSEQTRMYQSLLDQQLAQVLSARGSTGLAAMIEKQLSRGLVAEQNAPSPPAAAGERAGEAAPTSAVEERTCRFAPTGSPLRRAGTASENAAVPAAAQRAFVERLWPHAHEASAGHRHPGPLHDRPGGAGDRLGPGRIALRRRHADLQPVRHQGRPRLARRGGRGHHHRST
jgi:Rod binding domain-containing protein